MFLPIFFLFFRHIYEKTIKLVGCIFLSLDGTKSKKVQVTLSATDITTGDKLHFLITSCTLITCSEKTTTLQDISSLWFSIVQHILNAILIN